MSLVSLQETEEFGDDSSNDDERILLIPPRILVDEEDQTGGTSEQLKDSIFYQMSRGGKLVHVFVFGDDSPDQIELENVGAWNKRLDKQLEDSLTGIGRNHEAIRRILVFVFTDPTLLGNDGIAAIEQLRDSKRYDAIYLMANVIPLKGKRLFSDVIWPHAVARLLVTLFDEDYPSQQARAHTKVLAWRSFEVHSKFSSVRVTNNGDMKTSEIKSHLVEMANGGVDIKALSLPLTIAEEFDERQDYRDPLNERAIQEGITNKREHWSIKQPRSVFEIDRMLEHVQFQKEAMGAWSKGVLDGDAAKRAAMKEIWAKIHQNPAYCLKILTDLSGELDNTKAVAELSERNKLFLQRLDQKRKIKEKRNGLIRILEEYRKAQRGFVPWWARVIIALAVVFALGYATLVVWDGLGSFLGLESAEKWAKTLTVTLMGLLGAGAGVLVTYLMEEKSGKRAQRWIDSYFVELRSMIVGQRSRFQGAIDIATMAGMRYRVQRLVYRVRSLLEYDVCRESVSEDAGDERTSDIESINRQERHYLVNTRLGIPLIIDSSLPKSLTKIQRRKVNEFLDKHWMSLCQMNDKGMSGNLPGKSIINQLEALCRRVQFALIKEQKMSVEINIDCAMNDLGNETMAKAYYEVLSHAAKGIQYQGFITRTYFRSDLDGFIKSKLKSLDVLNMTGLLGIIHQEVEADLSITKEKGAGSP